MFFQLVHLGPFVFTPQQAYISLISSIIVIPVNIIIITLFRKAKPKTEKNIAAHTRYDYDVESSSWGLLRIQYDLLRSRSNWKRDYMTTKYNCQILLNI